MEKKTTGLSPQAQARMDKLREDHPEAGKVYTPRCVRCGEPKFGGCTCSRAGHHTMGRPMQPEAPGDAAGPAEHPGPPKDPDGLEELAQKVYDNPDLPADDEQAEELLSELKDRLQQFEAKVVDQAIKGRLLPQGGVLYFNPNVLWFEGIKEMIVDLAATLHTSPQNIEVTMNVETGKPVVDVMLPEGWTPPGMAVLPGAKKMIQGFLDGAIKTCGDRFFATLKARKKALGWEVVEPGKLVTL